MKIKKLSEGITYNSNRQIPKKLTNYLTPSKLLNQNLLFTNQDCLTHLTVKEYFEKHLKNKNV